MGKLTTPTDELNGPTTPKMCFFMTLRATFTPVAAVALSSALTNLSFTPSTPPSALIWFAASSAPRYMSIPVDDCDPVNGASTAISPGVNDFADAAEADDDHPPAVKPMVAKTTGNVMTRYRRRIRGTLADGYPDRPCLQRS